MSLSITISAADDLDPDQLGDLLDHPAAQVLLDQLADRVCDKLQERGVLTRDLARALAAAAESLVCGDDDDGGEQDDAADATT